MRTFLQVDKELFNKGLNPTEILVVAQIDEYLRNTGDCFISDDTLALQFGVSSKTIKRTIADLEQKGIIIRTTKNIKGGRERHMKLKINKGQNDPCEASNQNLQGTICPLTRDNLSFNKGQNDSIKYNIKENLKNKKNFFDESSPEPTADESSEAVETFIF